MTIKKYLVVKWNLFILIIFLTSDLFYSRCISWLQDHIVPLIYFCQPKWYTLLPWWQESGRKDLGWQSRNPWLAAAIRSSVGHSACPQSASCSRASLQDIEVRSGTRRSWERKNWYTAKSTHVLVELSPFAAWTVIMFAYLGEFHVFCFSLGC